MITINIKQNRQTYTVWLLNYEDFKIFTLSHAYSIVCMTLILKTI